MNAARVLLLVALFGLLAPAPAGAATHQVTMHQFAYSSASLTVRVGDQVTWTNHDEAPHDVVGGTFRSPLLSTGQSWTFTFTAPGNYSYYCSVHPDMRAQVIVLPVQTQAPAAPKQTVKLPATTAAPTTAAPTTAAVVPAQAPAPAAAAPVPAQQAAPENLDPMLLVAGIVAAVAVLCLLLIGARPEQ